MKYTIQATLFAFATLCTAQLQTLDNLPNCAKPCANNLPTQCNLGVQCICADQAFITGISCCVSTACSPADQQTTLNLAQQLCDTVNVKLPAAAGCSGSSSVGSGASTASGGSTAASGASTASGASVASSATSVGTGTASSATSNASVSAKSSTGATAGSATGSPTSTTASSTTSAKAATGAAQNLGSNIGAVGAAVAALALL